MFKELDLSPKVKEGESAIIVVHGCDNDIATLNTFLKANGIGSLASSYQSGTGGKTMTVEIPLEVLRKLLPKEKSKKKGR